MKTVTCDVCGKEEKCVVGADVEIQDYKYGPAYFQICVDCKLKVDANSADFILKKHSP